MPVGAQSEFQVKFTAQGIAALNKSIDRILGQVRNVRQETGRARRANQEWATSFRNIALRTIAFIGIVRSIRAVSNAFSSAVATGIKYNETIETATLGIASLISAQADLRDSQGEVISGAEEITVAYTLATEEVRKLRIAGIQTAATTQELVDAYQQAVGAGLSAGLNLDQIRQITIRLAQAAGALGIPYRQLNEEIRSLLSATTDQNTRIAKALSITNDQLRAAKEQNELADFLLEKFDAFGVAGERVVETWGGLRSTIQETVELLAGEALFPAFEELRTRGLGAVEQVFDFETAEISEDFINIIEQLQLLTGEVGEKLADGLELAVEAAQRLNEWLIDNEDIVSETTRNFVRLGESAAIFVDGILGVGAQFAAWTVSTGAVAQILETIGDVLQTIGRSPALSLLAGLTAGGGVVALARKFLPLPVQGFLLAATAVTTLSANIDALVETAAEATDALRVESEERQKAIREIPQQASRLTSLAREYERVTEAIDENQDSSEALEALQSRQADLLDRLVEINPEYAKTIQEGVDANRDLSEVIAEIIGKEKEVVEERKRSAQEALATAQRQLQVNEEFVRQNSRYSDIVRRSGEEIVTFGPKNNIQSLIDLITELEEEIGEADAALRALNALAAAGFIDVDTPETEDDEGSAARSRVQSEIASLQQQLALEEARLKNLYDRNKISYEQYYGDLLRVRRSFLNDIAAEYEELARLEEDEGRAARARERADETRNRIEILTLQNQARLYQERLKREEEYNQRRIQFARSTGDILTAVSEQVAAKYREDLAELENLYKESGSQLVQQRILELKLLIETETARAQFEAFEQQVSQAQDNFAREQERINALRSAGAITDAEAAELLAQAYDEYAASLQRILPLLREIAERIGDPQLVERVNEVEDEINKATNTSRELRDTWKEFRQGLATSATNNLSKFFSDAVIEAESLGDAVDNLFGSFDGIRNLLGSILQDMTQMLARMIAMQIIAAAFRAAGAPVPPGLASGGLIKANAALPRYGTGGYISGPVLSAASLGRVPTPCWLASATAST